MKLLVTKPAQLAALTGPTKFSQAMLVIRATILARQSASPQPVSAQVPGFGDQPDQQPDVPNVPAPPTMPPEIPAPAPNTVPIPDPSADPDSAPQPSA